MNNGKGILDPNDEQYNKISGVDADKVHNIEFSIKILTGFIERDSYLRGEFKSYYVLRARQPSSKYQLSLTILSSAILQKGKNLNISKMFSKYMFWVLGIVVKNGHYTGCLPYDWDFNTNTIKVSKSRIQFIFYYVSLAYTVIGSTVLLISYGSYLNTVGFHIRDLRNTFQFFVTCVFGMLCIFLYLILKRMETVSHMINAVVFFFNSIPGM